MHRVVHFEIHADDPRRAIVFYKQVFDWKITKWDGPVDYWLISTGQDKEPGINGALIQRRLPVSGESVIAFVCSVEVPSIDLFTKRITDAGGTIVVQKQSMPRLGWYAYFKDTEGNIVGITQNDPSAR